MLPPPLSPHSLKKPVSHFGLSFLRCIFIVQRCFTAVFHSWIYCSSIRSTPSIALLCPVPSIPQLSVCFVISSSFLYRWNEMYFYIIDSPSFYFPFLSLPSPLKQSHYQRHTYIWSCLYLDIYLSFGSIFYIWQKTSNVCFYEPGLLNKMISHFIYLLASNIILFFFMGE
jgi:hypothetical protein